MSYFSLDDNRKIGIGLSTAGLLFTVLGIFMFFDRGLLAMGNVRTQHKSKHARRQHTVKMRAQRIRSLSIKRLLTLRFFKFSCAQLLFLSGVMLIIGPTKTYRFFFQKRKAKGTACFLGGIALVLYGWAMIGIIVEGWGFLNLFGDFFPTALCVALASTHTHTALCTRTQHDRSRIFALLFAHDAR